MLTRLLINTVALFTIGNSDRRDECAGPAVVVRLGGRLLTGV